MSKKLYNIVLIILAFSIVLNIFGIINTMVSQKYETDSYNCISKISGRNLCNDILEMKWYIGIALFLIVLILFFRNKLIKDRTG